MGNLDEKLGSVLGRNMDDWRVSSVCLVKQILG